MTKAKRHRLTVIRLLSTLSRDGWKNARYEDYAPLEKELRELEAQEPSK
jgi:hypothetical protein